MAAALVRNMVRSALSPLLRPRPGPAAPRAPSALLPPPPAPGPPAAGLKTRGIVRRRCGACYLVKRRGRWFVHCKAHPKHKQRHM